MFNHVAPYRYLFPNVYLVYGEGGEWMRGLGLGSGFTNWTCVCVLVAVMWLV